MNINRLRAHIFWARAFKIIILLRGVSLAFEVSTTPQISSYVGDTVELPCITDAVDVTVYWYYGDTAETTNTLVANMFKGEVLPRRENVDMTSDFSLHITDVGVVDAGVYVCMVVPSPWDETPKSSSTVLIVTDGGNVDSSTALPTPTTSKITTTLAPSLSRSPRINTTTSSLPSLSNTTQKMPKFLPEPSNGNFSVLLHGVSQAFEVSTTPQISSFVGDTVELPCITDAVDVMVYWYYGDTAETVSTLVANIFKGEVLPRRENVDMTSDFSLHITDVGVVDAGVYVCVVAPSPRDGTPKSSSTVLIVTDGRNIDSSTALRSPTTSKITTTLAPSPRMNTTTPSVPSLSNTTQKMPTFLPELSNGNVSVTTQTHFSTSVSTTESVMGAKGSHVQGDSTILIKIIGLAIGVSVVVAIIGYIVYRRHLKNKQTERNTITYATVPDSKTATVWVDTQA